MFGDVSQKVVESFVLAAAGAESCLRPRLQSNIEREVTKVRLRVSRASGPVAQLGPQCAALD